MGQVPVRSMVCYFRKRTPIIGRGLHNFVAVLPFPEASKARELLSIDIYCSPGKDPGPRRACPIVTRRPCTEEEDTTTLTPKLLISFDPNGD